MVVIKKILMFVYKIPFGKEMKNIYHQRLTVVMRLCHAIVSPLRPFPFLFAFLKTPPTIRS
jgi:hypothetical protein